MDLHRLIMRRLAAQQSELRQGGAAAYRRHKAVGGRVPPQKRHGEWRPEAPCQQEPRPTGGLQMMCIMQKLRSAGGAEVSRSAEMSPSLWLVKLHCCSPLFDVQTQSLHNQA